MTKLSRREFLKSAALAAAGALVSRFRKAPTEPDEPESFLSPLADACNVQFRVQYEHCELPPLIIYGYFDPDLSFSRRVFTDTGGNTWTFEKDDPSLTLELNGMPVILDRVLKMFDPPPDAFDPWQYLEAHGGFDPELRSDDAL